MAWGELGSYPLHGDKSGMGGFAMVIFLMPIRWVLAVIGLLVVSLLTWLVGEAIACYDHRPPGPTGARLGMHWLMTVDFALL